MKSVPVRPYHYLALYYDSMFLEFGQKVGRPMRNEILGPLMKNVHSACDLACGTGTAALDLARQGIRTYAVDLSPGMCRAARAKAKRAAVKIQVIRADMRDFRLPEPVDLITCEFDAINHVPAKEDLKQVAACAAAALTPGGHFCFDANNLLSFKKVWRGAWWNEQPGVVMVMRSNYDAKRRMGVSDVEWFIQEGKLWRRRSERVEEVCWTATEIRETLRAAGFGRIRTWDQARFFGKDFPLTKGCRTVWLARKGE
jgi:SAM-dependent methyltransferase